MAANVEPVKAIINGKKCVRVLDLAKAWGTSTATILATDKPHAVSDKYIHRVNGCVWCELEGLRKRAEATKNRKSSYISRNILALLDGLEKPETSKPTDLGMADLIADARRTASQALAVAEDNEKRVEKLEKRMDAAQLVVKSAANIAEEASEAVDRVETTAQQSADLAKENADIIRGEIERLTRLSDDVDKAKKKVRALYWTLAAVSALGVAARVVRLLRRR